MQRLSGVDGAPRLLSALTHALVEGDLLHLEHRLLDDEAVATAPFLVHPSRMEKCLGKDALECLRYTDNVEKSVRNVINTSWPPGSQNKEYFDSYLTINQLKSI